MLESHSLTGQVSTGVIACLSTANETFIGTSGTLFTINITDDSELAVGSKIQATLTEVSFSTTSAEEDLVDASFQITVGEPEDTRIVLDELSTTAPEDASGVDVRVKRTIKAGDWNTICLPFAMTEEQCKAAFGDDVELADFFHCEATYSDDDVIGLEIEIGRASCRERV